MNSLMDFLKKNKVYILILLCFFFYFRSCSLSGELIKKEKYLKKSEATIDSLIRLNARKDVMADSLETMIKKEKLKVYLYLDDTISRVDRGYQLMGFHKIIKDSIKALQEAE